MKLAGPKVNYVQVFTWATPWKKKQYKKTTRENKTKRIFVLMPLLSSSLQRGQMPKKNYLVRQICMKAWTLHISVHDDLRKFDGWKLSMKRLESKLSIKTREDFCKSGGLFNCEEKGKTLLSVVFWNLGDRENCLQVDIKFEQHYLKSKNFTMKGTMLLGVTLVYKFVVHCYKTLSLWDYPWLFGFLLYL